MGGGVGAWAGLGLLVLQAPRGTPRAGLPGWPGPDSTTSLAQREATQLAPGEAGAGGGEELQGPVSPGRLLPTALLAPHHPKDSPSCPGQKGTQPWGEEAVAGGDRSLGGDLRLAPTHLHRSASRPSSSPAAFPFA